MAGFHPSSVLRFLIRPDAGAGATAPSGREPIPVRVVARRPVMVAAAVGLEPVPAGVTGPAVPLAASRPLRPDAADASGRARGASSTAPIGAEVAVPTVTAARRPGFVARTATGAVAEVVAVAVQGAWAVVMEPRLPRQLVIAIPARVSWRVASRTVSPTRIPAADGASVNQGATA